MKDKLFASRIAAYKKVLASGEFQQTYHALVSTVQVLRTDFAKAYGRQFAVAHVLHGYIDVTYFYLQNAYLKEKKLKFALVLNHQQVTFELWLLGQTKDVQIRYWETLKSLDWVNAEGMPKYSIAEIPLVATPDFEQMDRLSSVVRKAFEEQTKIIIDALMVYS